MRKIRKRYIALFVLCGLAILLYFPISSYMQTLRIYYKFQSGIAPTTDSIFRDVKSESSYFPNEYNQVSRLFYLCKLWGFVKYNHDHLPLDAGRIDSVLMRAIPRAIHASSKSEYVSMLDSLLFFDETLFTGKNPYPDINDYYLIDNSWMKDTVCLNPELSRKLETIFYTRSGKSNRFVYNKSMVGNIRIENEPQYAVSDYSDQVISLLALFRYWNVINYFWVYKNDADNWDEVLYKSIPRFLDITSKKQYHQEIYRLTNQLKDTHSSYPRPLIRLFSVSIVLILG